MIYTDEKGKIDFRKYSQKEIIKYIEEEVRKENNAKIHEDENGKIDFRDYSPETIIEYLEKEVRVEKILKNYMTIYNRTEAAIEKSKKQPGKNAKIPKHHTYYIFPIEKYHPDSLTPYITHIIVEEEYFEKFEDLLSGIETMKRIIKEGKRRNNKEQNEKDNPLGEDINPELNKGYQKITSGIETTKRIITEGKSRNNKEQNEIDNPTEEDTEDNDPEIDEWYKEITKQLLEKNIDKIAELNNISESIPLDRYLKGQNLTRLTVDDEVRLRYILHILKLHKIELPIIEDIDSAYSGQNTQNLEQKRIELIINHPLKRYI